MKAVKVLGLAVIFGFMMIGMACAKDVKIAYGLVVLLGLLD